MSTETVVFFYLQEGTPGRKYPWEKVRFPVCETMWCDRRVVAAGIPEYDFNRRVWKKNLLAKKIRSGLALELNVPCVETTCFLYEKSLACTQTGSLLEELFPIECITVPGKKGMCKVTPEDVVASLLDEYCNYDALIVMDGTAKGRTSFEEEQESVNRALDLPELIRARCERVNYLAVITADPEQYVEVLEELEDEYGLAGVLADSLGKMELSMKYKVLVVDAGIGDDKVWRKLPPCCTYLDLISDTERQRVIEIRRKDVRYLSFYRQIEKKLLL